jgi:hypothetical protein
MGGEIIKDRFTSISEMINADLFMNDGLISIGPCSYIVPYDNFVLNGSTFRTKGIYFGVMDNGIMESITIPNYTGFNEKADVYSSVIVDTSSRLSELTITKNGVYDAKNCLSYDDVISFKYDLSDIDIDKFYNETEHNYGDLIRYGRFERYPSSMATYVYVKPASNYKHTHLMVEIYSERVHYAYMWYPEPEYGINEPGWYDLDYYNYQAKRKIEKEEAS